MPEPQSAIAPLQPIAERVGQCLARSRFALSAVILFVLFVIYAVRFVIPASNFYNDEGLVADIGNQLAQGKVLYRDVSAPYGPVVFYLYGICFRLFGAEFYPVRLVGLGIILAEGIVLALITAKLTDDRWAALAAALMLFLCLGTYQADRLTASTVAGLFSLLALYLHYLYLLRPATLSGIGFGLSLGLCLLTKQGIFAFDLLAHGLMVIYISIIRGRLGHRFDRNYFILPAIGFAVPVGGYIAYAWTFLHLVIIDTITTIPAYGRALGLPFPRPSSVLLNLWHGNWTVAAGAARMYVMTGVLIPFAIVLRRLGDRTRVWGTLLLGSVAIIQFMQVFPVSDESHYVRATIVLPALFCVLLVHCVRYRQRRAALLVMLAIAVHLAPAILEQAPKIRAGLRSPWSQLPHSAHIRKDWNDDVLGQVIDEIRRREGPLIIVNSHNYLYFLADRPHVSRYSAIDAPFSASSEQQREIIGDIERNSVRNVVVGPRLHDNWPGLDQLPLLNQYIHDHFVLTKAIAGYQFLVLASDDRPQLK